MSQRQLIVKKRVTEVPGVGSHRLQMWVDTYVDMDPEIFVYQRKQPVPPAVDEYDEYCNIASAADMAEYPVDNPDPELPPFFRKTSIDILFRSVNLMYTSIQRMEADIQALINNLDFLDEEGFEEDLSFNGKVFP